MKQTTLQQKPNFNAMVVYDFANINSGNDNCYTHGDDGCDCDSPRVLPTKEIPLESLLKKQLADALAEIEILKKQLQMQGKPKRK